MENTRLDTALRELELHEWTADAIEAHKSAELAKAPPPSTSWRYRKLIEVISGITEVTGGLSILVFVVGFVAYVFLNDGSWWRCLGGWLAVGGILAAFFLAFISDVFDKAKKSIVEPAMWEKRRFWDLYMPRRAGLLGERTLKSVQKTNVQVFALTQHKESDQDGVFGGFLTIDGRFVAVWDGEENIVLPPGVDPPDESKRIISVDCSMRFHEMIRASGLRRTDTEISAKRFPIDPNLTGRWLWKIYPWQEEMKSFEDAAAILAKDNFVLARHEHGFAFEGQFPIWHPDGTLVCAGWQSEHPRNNNFHEVLCFGDICGRLGMKLEDSSPYWMMREECFFLGVRRVD